MASAHTPLTKGQIAGISIGASVAFFALLAVFVLFLTRGSQRSPDEPAHLEGQGHEWQELAHPDLPELKATLPTTLEPVNLLPGDRPPKVVREVSQKFEPIESLRYHEMEGIYMPPPPPPTTSLPRAPRAPRRGPPPESAAFGTASLWDIEIEKSKLQPPTPTILPLEKYCSPSSSGSPSDHFQGRIEAPAVFLAEDLVRDCEAETGPVRGIMNTPEIPLGAGCIDDFPCADCERSFAKRYELNRHIRLQHIKPHKCTVQGCEYEQIGFGKPNDLARHMTNVHRNLAGPQNLHLCPVDGCEYHVTGFGRKDNWKRHVTQQHGISVD